jgi:hypothetical protein
MEVTRVVCHPALDDMFVADVADAVRMIESVGRNLASTEAAGLLEAMLVSGYPHVRVVDGEDGAAWSGERALHIYRDGSAPTTARTSPDDGYVDTDRDDEFWSRPPTTAVAKASSSVGSYSSYSSSHLTVEEELGRWFG